MGLVDSFKVRRDSAMKNLTEAVEKPNYYSSNDFYIPEKDSAGNASVVIRFLPQKNPDANPFVSYYKHIFRDDTNGWFIVDICGTTFGQHCKVCELNSILWNTESKEKQEIARTRKRKKEYICNILIIKDPKSPEKEGTVVPFKFGPAVYNKIKEAIKPSFAGDPSFNPFDLWEGADFMLRIRKDELSKQVTYADSKFAAPSELFGGNEEKLEQVLEQCADLNKYVDPSLVLSDTALEEKCQKGYYKCLPDYFDGIDTSSKPKQKEETKMPKFDAPVRNASKSDEDDTLAAFRNMVNDLDNDSVPF